MAKNDTSHVRHRAKYLEVPLPEERAFVFTCGAQPYGARARTLKEFVTIQRRLPMLVLEDHAQRGDFSHWVAEVFGDQPLAAAIRAVEKEYRRGGVANLSHALIAPILERYEVTG